MLFNYKGAKQGRAQHKSKGRAEVVQLLKQRKKKNNLIRGLTVFISHKINDKIMSQLTNEAKLKQALIMHTFQGKKIEKS